MKTLFVFRRKRFFDIYTSSHEPNAELKTGFTAGCTSGYTAGCQAGCRACCRTAARLGVCNGPQSCLLLRSNPDGVIGNSKKFLQYIARTSATVAFAKLT